MPKKTVKTTNKIVKATKATKKSVKKPNQKSPKTTVLKVKNFGSKGDTFTDDTVAIATALEKAAARSSYPAVSVVVTPVTEAQKIWEEIRYRPIEMFALPNQVVEQHCTPFPAEPNRLFLTVRSTATLPSLEVACGKDFVVELADKFVIVARAVASPIPPKK